MVIYDVTFKETSLFSSEFYYKTHLVIFSRTAKFTSLFFVGLTVCWTGTGIPKKVLLDGMMAKGLQIMMLNHWNAWFLMPFCFKQNATMRDNFSGFFLSLISIIHDNAFTLLDAAQLHIIHQWVLQSNWPAILTVRGRVNFMNFATYLTN